MPDLPEESYQREILPDDEMARPHNKHLEEARPKYWPEFLDSVRSLNAFVHPGVLRRFQADILDSGGFMATSPTTGEEVLSRCNAAAWQGRTAYYFKGKDEFFLLVSHGYFELGSPVSETILGRDGEYIHLRKNVPRKKISEHELGRLLHSGREAAEIARSARRPAMLVLGHENFAHQFWNELPALEAWLQTATDKKIADTPLYLSGEPLGPIRAMFPRLSAAKLYDGISSSEIPMFVRLGGKRVPANVRKIVCDFVITRGDTPPAAHLQRILMRGFPRVWMSVRHGSRTPDNQADFVRAVVRQLLKRYPDAAVVFDGFSFPDGFFSDPRTTDLRARFLERSVIDKDFIDAVIDDICSEHGPDVATRLCTTSELSLSEAICVAGVCNLYVCHGGTLQHKIAWFHNIPGIVHTAALDQGYALWCAGQIEGTIIPEMLPPDLSAPTSAPKNRQNKPRNYNYHIADVELAAEMVTAAFKRMLST